LLFIDEIDEKAAGDKASDWAIKEGKDNGNGGPELVKLTSACMPVIYTKLCKPSPAG